MRRTLVVGPRAWLQLSLFLLIGLVTALASRLFDGVRAVRRSSAPVRPLASQLARLEELMAKRDRSTLGHCGRVAMNARALALAMGLGHEEAETVFWTGMFHDIGKLGVRSAVLQKRGALDPLDWLEIERHPDLGADLLGWMGAEFEDIAAGVRAHHERWDGTGYPHREAGQDIPLAGRIVAIVDAFEALTSERPYSRAVPPPMAIALLAQDAGTHFDPTIVPVFEELCRTGDVLVAEERIETPFVLEASPIWTTG